VFNLYFPTFQNSNNSEVDFKLPLEDNPTPKPNNFAQHRLHSQFSSHRRADHSDISLLDRWTEISSEDSYSSQPQDCFQRKWAISSDTSMASNMRAELEKSRTSFSQSPSSSIRQLPLVRYRLRSDPHRLNIYYASTKRRFIVGSIVILCVGEHSEIIRTVRSRWQQLHCQW
jgi:hypothetical protein